MEQYTIYCTAEQTEKALKLGAPIIVTSNHSDVANKEYYEVYHYESRTTTAIVLPTAEQMIGWLEEQGLWIHFCKPNQRPKLLSFSISVLNEHFKRVTIGGEYDSRKKVTLAAIDTALDYLSKNKK